jgi:2-(3-amino-3-carboxypropyl)histidine synthase
VKHINFEEERIKQEIIRRDAKRVLVQLPEGLKPEAPRLAKIVEKCGALAIVSADPCYGACDLATVEAESLNVDLIVHFGHAKLLKYEHTPTIYVEARASLSIEDSVCKALHLMIEWKKIGLTTTVQHVQTLDNTRELLLQAGKTVVIGDYGRMSYPGQVIGCDYSNARSVREDVDAFLFIGGGKFHALGVALATLKPTVVADPYDGTAYRIDAEVERILKQRWACIQEARKATLFGVLIGLKPGQKRFDEALSMKAKIAKSGRSVVLFAAYEVSPDIFLEFPSVEAYVNTACPRLSLDDASRFRRPVLSYYEGLVVVGELTWEELCRRGLLEN